MPIIKEVKAPCRHPKIPPVSSYWFGTIWECDDCRRQFELKEGWRDGRYWSPLQSTNRITPLVKMD